MEREVTQDDLNEIEEICYNDGYEIDDIQDAMTVLADELVKEMSYDYEPDILKGVKFIEYQIKYKQENNEYDINKPVEFINTGMPEDCSFYEAKQYLNSKGYILVEARGKTNIEDFNKMKSDVSQITNIPGKNFEFVTGNAKGSVDDERSTMIIGWGNRGEYTYDTGRPGFSRYRKITREKVLDIIKEKQKEIEHLGYNVEFVDNNVKIWMPKSDLKPAEDETEMTLFGIFNDGGNCWSSRDDEHWLIEKIATAS